MSSSSAAGPCRWRRACRPRHAARANPTWSPCTRASPPRPAASSAAPQFARMKRGAYFVNTARGPHGRLRRRSTRRWRAGHLRGAMLETFWQSSRRRPTGRCCKLRQRHADPAHRRRLDHHREDRRAHGRRGSRAAIWPASRRSTRAEQEQIDEQGELEQRREIIAACRWMNASALNQGTSGNISVRYGDSMLITPVRRALRRSWSPRTSWPCAHGRVRLRGQRAADSPPPNGASTSTSCSARPDVGAIVHTHSTFATALASARKAIPAAHYMIAAFGGPNDPLRRLRDLRHQASCRTMRWRRWRSAPAACSPITA